jgi:Fe-S-cluster containining protein
MGEKQQLDGFVCQRCGVCCRWSGHVLLTSKDITQMADAVGVSEERFIEEYTMLAANRRQLSLKEHSDGACIFLQDNQCHFYEARPEQCRSFPHAWRVAEGCPALDAMDKADLKR